jgi:uncharacterized protein (TIGR00251 family)
MRETPDGVEIAVRVVPRARKDGIAGYRGEALLVRVAAPPIDGEANAALVRYLASRLGLPMRAVQIVAGDRAREKRILISGLTAEALRQALDITQSG